MSKIVESKTIVGLEVGTSKVVAVVGEVLPDGVVNVLGVGSCPSKGIDKGSITDLKPYHFRARSMTCKCNL